MFLSMNLFDISTIDAIRYFVKRDSVINGDPNGYRNSGAIVGSTGMELEYRFNAKFGFVKFSYSYYSVGSKGIDSAVYIAASRSTTLGSAQNKFSLYMSINLGNHFYFSPSCYYLGDRYAYTSLDANGNGQISLIQPQFIATAFLGTKNWIRNLEGGIGVRNITDQQELFLQPYNSLHAPLPGMGREIYLKLSYKFESRNRKTQS